MCCSYLHYYYFAYNSCVVSFNYRNNFYYLMRLSLGYYYFVPYLMLLLVLYPFINLSLSCWLLLLLFILYIIWINCWFSIVSVFICCFSCCFYYFYYNDSILDISDIRKNFSLLVLVILLIFKVFFLLVESIPNIIFWLLLNPLWLALRSRLLFLFIIYIISCNYFIVLYFYCNSFI